MHGIQAELFPSPRGDKLRHEKRRDWVMTMGFRPLAGINCISKTSPKYLAVFVLYHIFLFVYSPHRHFSRPNLQQNSAFLRSPRCEPPNPTRPKRLPSSRFAPHFFTVCRENTPRIDHRPGTASRRNPAGTPPESSAETPPPVHAIHSAFRFGRRNRSESVPP